jgi:hypothetical protein
LWISAKSSSFDGGSWAGDNWKASIYIEQITRYIGFFINWREGSLWQVLLRVIWSVNETYHFCSTFVYYNQKLINTPNYDVLLWNQVVEKNYEQALKDPKVLARFELHLWLVL